MTEYSLPRMVRIRIGRFFRTIRYEEEYQESLRVLNVGDWNYLYHALEGPNADQVCVALKQWLDAFQVKQSIQEKVKACRRSVLPNTLPRLLVESKLSESSLRWTLHVLVYGETYHGQWGYE